MKFFTNKGIVQKTVISLLIVILTTFAVPATVQADVGGKLMNPIINFVTALFDGIQHLLEMAMLGETSGFMKDIGSGDYEETSSGPTITTDEFIDATFFGLNKINVPVINYTPEAIFSNQVPALDVNFISPSIQGDDERNVAVQLQGVISSWYLALRSIAVVGLLSVLVYLGIRMLMTSIAADRAKYKQMLMDWLVGICLVFVLHYIMSFALTMAETVTAMLSSEANGTFTVTATGIDGAFYSTTTINFSSNLMSYVRFMVQAGDLNVKLAFFALYIMLVIFSIRFTWIYLKRVVNMAFLTIIAPMVGLMYPIDKVSDGKAQAFNMWLKEYTYNALIQPLDLLLYKVLLGSAIELAVDNPLYAIVALGFIIAAEKLLKKMFGFDKASGGTLGSLAGAAGVSALAGSMLNNIGKKVPGGGGNGKIRTKDSTERQGKDADGNKPFKAFEGKNADDVMGSGIELPAPTSGENEVPPLDNNVPPPEEKESLDDLEQQRAELYNQGYTDDSDEIKALNEKIQSGDWTDEQAQQSNSDDELPIPPSEDDKELGFRDTVKQDIKNFGNRLSTSGAQAVGNIKDTLFTSEGRKQLGSNIRKGARKRAIGAWKAAPTAVYKATRGTLRAASRVALAGAMGGMGLVLGATTGDGDKAVSMALGAAGVGFATGDNLFDASVGKLMRDKSVRDAYEAGKYGNRIDARNARADKEYFRSEKFDDYYEKYYKGKKDMNGEAYTKQKVREITQSYRKAGITNEGEIRRAIKLEEKYIKESNGKLSAEDARAQVQNIVQSYKDMDMDKKAFSDAKAREKEIQRIAGMLGGQTQNNKKMAQQIFRGYEDWRDSAV